jgi:hypothetical protein
VSFVALDMYDGEKGRENRAMAWSACPPNEGRGKEENRILDSAPSADDTAGNRGRLT